MMSKSPLKWHGGKSRLVPRLLEIAPRDAITRVEPYGGALWWTLAQDPNDANEIVNDLSLELSNFWWSIRDEDTFEKMVRYLEATPMSELEFKSTEISVSNVPDWKAAAEFFIRCRMSRAANFKSYTPITKNRLRRGQSEQASSWWTAIDSLEQIYFRLRRVHILHRPALDVISTLDSPGTLFYLDPPYPSGVRTSPDMYAHEMSDENHEELLEFINRSWNGRFMLSGKQCEMYDKALKNWNRIDIDVPLDSAAGQSKRRTIECVWTNYDTPINK